MQWILGLFKPRSVQKRQPGPKAHNVSGPYGRVTTVHRPQQSIQNTY